MSNSIGRRTFLRRAITVMLAAIGAVFGASAVAYILPPKQAEAGAEWLPLGSTRNVALGEPTLLKTSVDYTTGWQTTTEDIAVYVKTDDGRDFIGMSNICTHLGCRVRWVEDRRQFYCPCHAGVYDENGNVVSGPPPRPLDRYELDVEGDEIEFQPTPIRVQG
ncbi:MAG: Rieske 2Fe-2S domain-containing protein [Actinobacteria bacterium]|nr:Rieske 2Fe-2S domain-containing protein [Actinomycetota bacterium]